MHDPGITQRPAAETIIYLLNINISYQLSGVEDTKLKQHFENHFAARNILVPPELENPESYPFLEEEKIPINEDAPAKKESAAQEHEKLQHAVQ